LLLFFKRKRLKKEGRFRKFLIFREGWLGNFYKNATKSGHQVLCHTIAGSKRYPLFRKKGNKDEIKEFYLDDEAKLRWERITESCIKEFNPSEWPSREVGVDLSPILDERFIHFLQRICPIISATVRQYEETFKKEKIDYVLCQYKIFPSDFGVMSAATVSPDVSSVHIEHGSTEIEYHMHYFTEQPANIYVPSSKEEARFFEGFFNYDQTNKSKIIVARGWIDKYKGEAKKATDRFSKPTANSRLKKVYYLPAVLLRQRFGTSYPLCWYHFLQRNLCKHFAKLSQYNFVIKGHSVAKWLNRPLLDFLKNLKAPNISYQEGNLLSNLRKADRVITDYPSTPTYEARLMGLPVLSLYHESINIRRTAQEAHGKTLVSFRQTDQMLEQIDRFLSSDPKEYIIPMENNYMNPTLLEIMEKSEVNV